ncbi:AHH domain-containing protein [uncultured Sphingomonas sp.]|uniref:AHH domain-containing protein n=1 Tax=uncultured Sphingomonas sp. TaxID=158754 RepID=UPI0035C9D164
MSLGYVTPRPVDGSTPGGLPPGLVGDRLWLAQANAAPASTPVPRGSVRLPGGHIATAVQVLQMLRGWSEYRQVDHAIDRFRLDRNDATDLLAARAYVWATYNAPLFSRAGFSGPTLERAAHAIMAYERTHPGTALLAERGHSSSQAALTRIANDAVAGGQVVERRSAVAPSLSTNSAAARAQLAPHTRMQNWQAHHLIPFAEIAKLPVPVQLAIARSGWRMDSAENLMALPADRATFLALPNNRVFPMHSSSHPNYSADVGNSLSNLRLNGATMTPARIRSELEGLEAQWRAKLSDQAPPFWPRVD